MRLVMALFVTGMLVWGAVPHLVPDDALGLFTDLGIENNSRLRVPVQVSWMAFDHWGPGGDPRLWNPAAKIFVRSCNALLGKR